jgi:hypothetical protein
MYEPVIDWGDPRCRLGLIERVGIDEYNRLFAEHCKRRLSLPMAGMRSGRSTPRRIQRSRTSATDNLGSPIIPLAE